MTVQKRIIEKLEREFQPSFLRVTNDSALHAGHAGAGEETHFTIEMVSSRFSGLAKIARHRLVNHCLADELNGPVHALSLKLKSPQEL